MPKKTEKLFFDVKISCGYRIFYDHEFFCPRQDHIQVSQIFFKGHRTKIDENRDHTPPHVLGGG